MYSTAMYRLVDGACLYSILGTATVEYMYCIVYYIVQHCVHCSLLNSPYCNSWFHVSSSGLDSLVSLFDSQCLLHMRPGIEGGEGAQAGPDPVHHEVLHGCVTPAAELERGGEDWVEVSTTGGECKADHGGANEAVDGRGVLRVLHGDQTRAESADESADSLNDCSVEDWDCQVSGAYVIDSRVGAAHVSFRDLESPEYLDQPEDEDTTDSLGHGSNCSLLFGHVPLHALLEVVVGTGSGVPPVLGPPDSQQE
jgi:hypothetical protein